MDKKIVVAGLFLSALLVGCSGGDEGMTGHVGSDNSVSVSVPDKEVDSRIPNPDIGEVVDVMRTFDNFDEFEGKLLELGLDGSNYVAKDVILAGDGEKNFVVNIHGYVYNGEVLVVYEKDGLLVNDLPESIGKNVWDTGEFEKYLEDLPGNSEVSETMYE